MVSKKLKTTRSVLSKKLFESRFRESGILPPKKKLNNIIHLSLFNDQSGKRIE
ncbi:hypothetical protein DDD_3453 [Nonlabens dokdonensis DSW-6]|uniref:Uncharacterized protein n=1 Tax=Nonlabens dokdonensis (strain DSM 17205 / KCTC 12402 / DSW-6) TaxID=592029 RepID=L7WA74_NONDD|nr:hypothetical protein DDD_3453 [Nonlabens dokdonensis DSW-6]